MSTKTAEKKQEELDEARLEAAAKRLMESMTNADKRSAVKFFDASFEDLDEFDQMVLFAHLADRSRSLEELDSVPLLDLKAVILGD